MRARFAPLLLASLAALALAAAPAPRAAPRPDPAPRAEPPVTPLTSYPDGYLIVAQTDSLAGLIAAAKPTFTYRYGSFHTMFVWTGLTSAGQRTFTLATARYLVPKRGKARWVLFATRDESIYIDDQTLPRTSIKLSATPATAATGYQQTYALVAARHPQLGTLYQIGFHTEPSGCCGAIETRLFLLHQPDGPGPAWRFVGEFAGNMADDVETSEVTTHATFTSDPAKPLRLTLTRATLDSEGPGAPLTRYYRDTYEGPLPLRTSTGTFAYLKVAKGDSYSILTGRLAAEALPSDMKPRQKRQALDRLNAEIRRLNPALDPTHLEPGQVLRVPDYEPLLSLLGVAG